MRRLTINGKEYTVEFSIEASLYSECTEAAMNLIMGYGEAQGDIESARGEVTEEEMNEEQMNAYANDVQDKFRSAIKKFLCSYANVPSTAMTLFYAGLLEHHNLSMDEAKRLIALYIDENGVSFLDVLNLMLECMGEDHFFELTGLAKVLNTATGENTKKPSRRKKTGED